MNVISEKDNSLYSRKEVHAEFSSSTGTPSRQGVLSELKKKFGDNIVIITIHQGHGVNKVAVNARAYSNKESMEKFEPDYRFKRSEPKKAKEEAK